MYDGTQRYAQSNPVHCFQQKSTTTAMKVFAPTKLTHTLQTWLGMVVDNGRPRERQPITISGLPLNTEFLIVPKYGPKGLSEEDLIQLFTTCVLEHRMTRFNSIDDDTKRFRSNIHACYDPDIGIGFMKRNVVTLKRLDLEQAAAVVISTIHNDCRIENARRAEVVSALIKELDYVLLTESCMWLEKHYGESEETVEEAKISRLVGLLRRMTSNNRALSDELDLISAGDSKNWSSMLPILLRIRRCKPRSRCLFIPQWVFDTAGMKPHSERKVWDAQGRVRPGHEPVTQAPPQHNDIILQRKAFRSLQRRLLHIFRFWNSEIRLRKAITDLEANVIYSASRIKSKVLHSENSLVLAHYFFALQRRLQRKVVSDVGWSRFLEKGESGDILQNNPEIPTTFEQRLSEFSGQTGVTISGPLLQQIDSCCLLMEEYVSVYGNGDRKNLTFSPGVSGGSGRGAVDDYNLLCDVLKTLCKAAKEEGVEYPGPVRKFLAKDIMAWNQSFEDDAFANGRVPGWETWLEERKKKGLVEGMSGLEVGEARTN